MASSFLIIVLLPFLLIVSLLVKFDSKGPVFFMQSRVGKDLNLFKVYKFRTMTDEKRIVANFIGKAKGITMIGYYLRRYKLDEIPQLFNVLKGDMSLVGPRPSIEKQLEEMTSEEKKRYSVHPGMTGLAQVCGNIHISWKDRYQYDLRYIKNISLGNDWKIIFRTIFIIIMGEEEFINQPLTIKEIK